MSTVDTPACSGEPGSIGTNRISDFPTEQFSIALFCDACMHQGVLDQSRVPEDLEIPVLIRRLHCAECGSRDCSIRIIFTGAGVFRHFDSRQGEDS